MFFINITVGKDDIVNSFINAGLSLFAKIVERIAQTFLTFCYFKNNRQLLCVESFIADIAKDIKLRISENRLWQSHHLTV